MELFADQARAGKPPSQPLADRMRPATIDEFVGQDHLLGPGKLLRGMIAAGQLQSLILWGPPGSGKTTLAQILARPTGAVCIHFSAVTSGVKELKKIIEEAERLHRLAGNLPCCSSTRFTTSIRRNRIISCLTSSAARSDLIGATTENPSFEVIAPLLSRCRVLVLQTLTADRNRHDRRSRAAATAGAGWEQFAVYDRRRQPERFSISSRKAIAVMALNALEAAATLRAKPKARSKSTCQNLQEALQENHCAMTRRAKSTTTSSRRL